VGATANRIKAQADGVDRWIHVALVEDGDSWKLYLNGKDDTASGGSDAQRCANYTGGIRFGTNSAGANDFDGSMADFAFWKGTALTATQIASLASGVPVQRQGLVAYYKLDEESGNRADSSGNGLTLTDTNTVTYGTGVVSNAAQFDDATEEKLTIAAATLDAVMDWQRDWTVCAWALQHDSTGGKGIISKDTASTSPEGFNMYFDGANNLMTYSDGLDVIAEAGTLTANIWWFAYVQMDGAYSAAGVNGRVNDRKANNHMAAVSSDPLDIGLLSTSYYLDGNVDEVTIWNRALMPDEVNALYIKGWNGKEITSSEIPETSQGKHRMFQVF